MSLVESLKKCRKVVTIFVMALMMTASSTDLHAYAANEADLGNSDCVPYDIGSGYGYVESTCLPAYCGYAIAGAIVVTAGIIILIITGSNVHNH